MTLREGEMREMEGQGRVKKSRTLGEEMEVESGIPGDVYDRAMDSVYGDSDKLADPIATTEVRGNN